MYRKKNVTLVNHNNKVVYKPRAPSSIGVYLCIATDTVAQSLTPVDLKWSSPTSVVSWPWWCIDYISRKNEICFGALFKISKKIVLFYYIFYHNSLWWIFLIILTADLISDDSFRFVWYVTLYTFAKEIKAYFLVTLLYKTMLNSKI